MPSILLINENKIVSRLLQLSSEKNGYNLEEVSTLDSSGDSYDVIFVDSDKYSDALMGQIESKLNYEQLGYIGTKQETAPEGFDLLIEKPFLPTDFVDMIKEQVIAKKSPSSTPSNDELDGFNMDDEADMLLEDDKFDLEDINEGVEELLVSDELEDEISLDDLDALEDIDLSLDPSLMMTTGVATSMALSDNSNEELADMVSEIDLMEEEDSLESLDEPLDLLTEDEISDELLPLEIEDITEQNLDDMLEELPLEEETPEDDLDTLAAVGAGVAAVGAVASDSLEADDIQEEISSLDDIDDLNELDLQNALGEEVVEEIISDEIVSDGEETVVESNDVQLWIRDAVAKAITPQMIKEALDGMDVNVTLSFNSKKEGDTTS